MDFTPFRKFLDEEDSQAIKASGIDSKGLDNKVILDTLNSHIAVATDEPVVTPYVAFGNVARVLAHANIILPQYIFLDKDAGEVVFDVTNFGSDVEYYLYFEYAMNETGYYDVFCELVSQEELEELLHMDLDGDDEEGEDEDHKEAVLGPVDEASDEKVKKPKYHVKIIINGKHEETMRQFGSREAVIKRAMARAKLAWPLAKSYEVKIDEEVINEISKKIMGPYAAKAAKQIDKIDAKTDKSYAEVAKKRSRLRGLHKAADKIDPLYRTKVADKDYPYQTIQGKKSKLKEETLSEISKEMLKRYIGDANAAASMHSAIVGNKISRGELNPELDYHTRIMLRRIRGVDKAKYKLKWKKIVDEEPLNEIPKETLKSYIKKAADDLYINPAPLHPGSNSDKGKAFNRRTGIQRAADRLADQDKPKGISGGSAGTDDYTSFEPKPVYDKTTKNRTLGGPKKSKKGTPEKNKKETPEQKTTRKRLGWFNKEEISEAMEQKPHKGHAYHHKTSKELDKIIDTERAAGDEVRTYNPKKHGHHVEQMGVATSILNWRKKNPSLFRKILRKEETEFSKESLGRHIKNAAKQVNDKAFKKE